MGIRPFGLSKTYTEKPYLTNLFKAVKEVFSSCPVYWHTYGGWFFMFAIVFYIIAVFENGVVLSSSNSIFFWIVLTTSIISLLLLRLRMFFYLSEITFIVAVILSLPSGTIILF